MMKKNHNPLKLSGRVVALLGALVIAVMTVQAQKHFAGRVYQVANVFDDGMYDEIEKEFSSMKSQVIAKFEEKKGRKPNAKEMAELEEKMAEARKKLEAMKQGMKMGITMEFTTEKDVVTKTDMKFSDEALKSAGIGWLKRKAMRAALALAPKSEKSTYMLNGNLLILTDSDGEKDTLKMSSDEKFIYTQLDEKTKFKLTRKK